MNSNEVCTYMEKSPSCPLKNFSQSGASGNLPLVKNMNATFGVRLYGNSAIPGTIDALHISSSSFIECHKFLGATQSLKPPLFVEECEEEELHEKRKDVGKLESGEKALSGG